MSRLRGHQRDDAGVTLVIALLFIVVVGLFATVALAKANSTTLVGEELRDRGGLQYALDGAIDRGLQVLKSDVVGGTESSPPAICPTVASAVDITQESGAGLALNGHNVHYSCETLAGRAKKTGDNVFNTNFAIVITGTGTDDFKSSNAISEVLPVSGSIYIAGSALDGQLKKTIEVTGGDVVGSVDTSNCATWSTSTLQNLKLAAGSSGYQRSCTEQESSEAYQAAVIPAMSASLGSSLSLGSCKIWFPGSYATAPTISNNSDNYFVSGAYRFDAGALKVPSSASIIGGKAASGDVAVPFASPCTGVTDANALLVSGAPVLTPLATGVEWIFSGTSTFENKGKVILNTPTTVGGDLAISIWATQHSGDPVVMDATDPGSTTLLNAKLYAPLASVKFFANSNTNSQARTGIVARTLDVGAPSGSGLAIFAPGGGAEVPAPPFRTVRLVATEPTGPAANKTTAVATISNFSPFTVKILSWRSQ